MTTGGTLTIRTKLWDHGNTVAIEVADTGHGIADKHIDRIFDPFFTTKGSQKGTGLGLSVSYGIVKQHGGEIEVISYPGRGSTFIVVLPLSASTSRKGRK
jgi:signal transduction histidine kinase